MYSLFSTSVALFAVLASAYTTPTTQCTNACNPIYKPGLNEVVPAGKPYTITWGPTTPGTVTLVLLKGPSTNILPLYAIAEKIENAAGTFTWTPAQDLQPTGNMGYGIQLINDADGTFQYSTQFGISNPSYSGGSSSTSPSTSATGSGSSSGSSTGSSTGSGSGSGLPSSPPAPSNLPPSSSHPPSSSEPLPHSPPSPSNPGISSYPIMSNGSTTNGSTTNGSTTNGSTNSTSGQVVNRPSLTSAKPAATGLTGGAMHLDAEALSGLAVAAAAIIALL